jgi:hypothetical protein
VASGGHVATATISRSLKPTSATSSGTRTSRSRSASAMPRPIWSLLQEAREHALLRRARCRRRRARRQTALHTKERRSVSSFDRGPLDARIRHGQFGETEQLFGAPDRNAQPSPSVRIFCYPVIVHLCGYSPFLVSVHASAGILSRRLCQHAPSTGLWMRKTFDPRI